MSELTAHQSLYEDEADIKAGLTLRVQGIWLIGKALQRISEGKKYKQELGYKTFEEYMQSRWGMSRQAGYKYMTVANSYDENVYAHVQNLGFEKLYQLSTMPQEERQDFISQTHEVNGEQKTVDDMTTRELQTAIKAQKQAEQRAEEAEQQLAELKNQEPRVIEKEIEVLPKDYKSTKRQLQDREEELERTKKKLSLIEQKANVYEKNSKEYENLKTQVDQLTKQKTDLSRRIKASTELSGLVVEIENFLKDKLSPIKYSRAIHEASTEDIVRENLQDIVNRVYAWCDEMNKLIPEKAYENYIDVEGVNVNG